MAKSPQLEALVAQPFELLKELERRSRLAFAGGQGSEALPEEWVGIGFRLGNEQFVANRNQVREILMLPEGMARVPGAQRWILGIANLRGHLLPIVDLKMLLGSGRTTLGRATRVISINHREIPAGLVVDEVQGFRRFQNSEFKETVPQTVVRCDRYLSGAYWRGHDVWPVFGLYDLLQSSAFLQAAAD